MAARTITRNVRRARHSGRSRWDGEAAGMRKRAERLAESSRARASNMGRGGSPLRKKGINNSSPFMNRNNINNELFYYTLNIEKILTKKKKKKKKSPRFEPANSESKTLAF